MDWIQQHFTYFFCLTFCNRVKKEKKKKVSARLHPREHFNKKEVFRLPTRYIQFSNKISKIENGEI